MVIDLWYYVWVHFCLIILDYCFLVGLSLIVCFGVFCLMIVLDCLFDCVSCLFDFASFLLIYAVFFVRDYC